MYTYNCIALVMVALVMVALAMVAAYCTILVHVSHWLQVLYAYLETGDWFNIYYSMCIVWFAYIIVYSCTGTTILLI